MSLTHLLRRSSAATHPSEFSSQSQPSHHSTHVLSPTSAERRSCAWAPSQESLFSHSGSSASDASPASGDARPRLRLLHDTTILAVSPIHPVSPNARSGDSPGVPDGRHHPTARSPKEPKHSPLATAQGDVSKDDFRARKGAIMGPVDEAMDSTRTATTGDMDTTRTVTAAGMRNSTASKSEQPADDTDGEAQIQRWMPWCGILINTATLETRVDVHRYQGADMCVPPVSASWLMLFSGLL